MREIINCKQMEVLLLNSLTDWELYEKAEGSFNELQFYLMWNKDDLGYEGRRILT